MEQVIKAIIQACQDSKQIDQSLIKFPENSEAYELRFLEEDDKPLPEMSFDALNRSRKLCEYNIDSLVCLLFMGFFGKS